MTTPSETNFKQTNNKMSFETHEAALAFKNSLTLEDNEKVRIRRRGFHYTNIGQTFDVVHYKK